VKVVPRKKEQIVCVGGFRCRVRGQHHDNHKSERQSEKREREGSAS
jgi:hypothetical protein